MFIAGLRKRKRQPEAEAVEAANFIGSGSGYKVGSGSQLAGGGKVEAAKKFWTSKRKVRHENEYFFGLQAWSPRFLPSEAASGSGKIFGALKWKRRKLKRLDFFGSGSG